MLFCTLLCGTQTITVDGRNVVPDVWEVLDKIKSFSEKVGKVGHALPRTSLLCHRRCREGHPLVYIHIFIAELAP